MFFNRILHLTESKGWSGGAAQCLALMQKLRQKGWNNICACPKKNGVLWQRAQNIGIDLLDFDPFQDYDIKTAWRLARFIDNWQPAVMHAHHPRAHAIAVIAKALCLKKPKPVLVVSRRVSHRIKTNIFSRLKYLSPSTDAYLAVAKSIGGMLKNYGVSPHKVNVVYSGTDTDIFNARPLNTALREQMGIYPDTTAIGLVGNFSHDKGQHILLSAAGKIISSGRKAVFVFAGRDTDGEQIKQLAQKNNVLPENTRFLGFRTDTADIISAMDITVNCAIGGEALSGSIRESMAMRVPVCASDISGNSEIVIDGVSGSLFEMGNARQLTEILSRFIDDKTPFLKMAQNGYETVQKNFSILSMADNTEKIYKKLIEPYQA